MGRIVCNEIDYSGSPLVTDSTPNASSVNPVTSAGVHKALVEHEELLKNTVGFTSKNLLNCVRTSNTANGISWTKNKDNSYTINGTATSEVSIWINDIKGDLNGNVFHLKEGNYILSSGNNTTSDKFGLQLYRREGSGNYASPYIFDYSPDNPKYLTEGDYHVRIIIASGETIDNQIIYPMLRKADIMDDTYEPYYIPVGELFGTNILTNSNVSAYTANNLLILRRDITNAYYNGSLKSEIAAANFKNVRPGDYIIGQTTGTTYYVVDLDYWWHIGDKDNVTENPGGYTHHLCIMPYRLLTTGTMTPLWQGWGMAAKDWHISTNDKGRCPWAADTTVDPQEYESVGKNDTTGGYLNSYIKTYALDRVYNEWLIADFGVDNVLKFRNRLGNTTNTSKTSSGQPNWNGCTSDWTWVDSYCDLPSEPNLFGNMIFSSSAMDVGCQYDQLALFKQASLFTFYDRMDVWTKAVSSSTVAASLSRGYASSYNASFAHWVCPLALIK